MSKFRLPMGFCLAVLAISLIFVGVQDTAPNAAAADPQPNARAVARVIEVQDRNTARLMALKGVVGTATGLDAAGQPVVKVFTAKAGIRGIPAKLEGVPVAVEVTGVFHALGDTTAKYEKAPIGVSTGHPFITAGTIGCRVKDAEGNVYALSNNHVYANENDANAGENGDNVLQPGPYDGATDTEYYYLGTLHAFELLEFDGTANTIDAAIALSNTELLDNKTLSDGYGTPTSTIHSAFVGVDKDVLESLLGEDVQKYGRTTSLTKGYVSAINASVNVGYSSGTARFVDQIFVQAYEGKFIGGGDSGSLLVTDPDKNPVGLLFAGPRSGRSGIANRIDLVLDRFDVIVDGGPSNDPPAVEITSPADGSTLDSGATVDFAGTATDTEDGDLAASLAWTSSIDGSIDGTGGSVSTALSDGNHTITASVTDSGGATGSDSISITVGDPPAGPTMHVASILVDLDEKVAGPNRFVWAVATVTIVDGSDVPVPVEGATVSGHWEGAATDSDSGTTDGAGQVSLQSDSVKNPSAAFTFVVDNVAKDGWTYIPGENTTGSVTWKQP